MNENTDLASPEATFAWGQALGESLRAGDVIALCGQLGAGKTHAVKGILAGVGSSEAATSPTFSMVHEYVRGRLPVFHFDFYRVERAEDLLRLGWDEYLDEPGVLVVEWADLFPALLPAHARWFRFEVLPQDARRVTRIAAPSE